MRLGSAYLRMVLEHLGAGRLPGPALDVGSYDGAAVAGLVAGRIIGLDPSPAETAACTGRMIRGNGKHPPFAPGTFATIFALDVLEHEPDDRRLAASLVDLLAPGGVLVVSVPHRDFRATPALATGPLHRRWGHVRTGYTPDTLAGLFGPGVRMEVTEWHEPALRRLYLVTWVLWQVWPCLARRLLRWAAGYDGRHRVGRAGHLFARIARDGGDLVSQAWNGSMVTGPAGKM